MLQEGGRWSRAGSCWCRTGNCWCRKVVAGSGLVATGTIYPTPPLGQDMTQGQFLSGV